MSDSEKAKQKNFAFIFKLGICSWLFISRAWKTFPNPNFIEMEYVFVNWHFLRKFQLQKAHLGLLFSSLLKMYVVGQD